MQLQLWPVCVYIIPRAYTYLSYMTDCHFAYVILPECCCSVCTVVQHSYLIYSWLHLLFIASRSSLIFTFVVKCEPLSHRENIIVNGYASPALENAQISLSCPPGYGFPDMKATMITSTCTNEAVWYPNISLLQCQGKYGIVIQAFNSFCNY